MKTQVVSLEDGGTTSAVTVRLVRAIDTDVKVTIGLDEAYLNDYNKSNETEYRVLDSDKLSFSKEAVIKAGQVSSEPVSLEIADFETLGVQYAIPLSINSVEGNVEKALASSNSCCYWCNL